MKKILTLSVLAAALLLAGVLLSPIGGDDPTASGQLAEGSKRKSNRKAGQPKPYKGDLPTLALLNIRNAVLDKVYAGLKYPWAMEFISGNELLITEFGGRLLRLDLTSGELREVEGLPENIATGRGQIGLMDIALHPEFAGNGIIYFSHAVESPDKAGRFATAVSMAVLGEQALTEVRQIFVATPFGDSPSNFGGALAFDDKGLLYIGTGDRSSDMQAQRPNALTGKIIRLTDRGRVPADNPFVDDPNTDDRIYALGVRNPQGLVFDRESGQLLETEHGPMGGDEVNRITAGANYGWPVISYGANYNTQKKGLGTALEGLQQPLYYYLPSIAVSPLAVYHGTMFPEWEGHLLVGALKGAQVSKLDLHDGAVIADHRLLDEVKGRIRDIKVAGDGSIYLLVQNGGRVYRLHRDFQSADLEQTAERRGGTVYKTICATCHSSGAPGVPQLDDVAAWTQRSSKGLDRLYDNTRYGIGDMPAAGLCGNCSERELRAAVDYMLRQAGVRAEATKNAGAKGGPADRGQPSASASAVPPNIVIMIADDLGWNDIGAYGNRFVQTPNIDGLAAHGLRYDNVFLTSSSCSPSRASILTGRYPHSNGLMHLHQALPATEVTVAQPLGDAGYHTVAVGKWHIGREPKQQFSQVREAREGSGTGDWITALRERPENKPFFFWLASRDPHRPWNRADDPTGFPYEPDHVPVPEGMVDGPATRNEVASYLGEVSRFDRDVGRVVAELRAQNVLENTLVIVMSDNGRPFHGGKQLLYDDGIKTPFIVHWPARVGNAGARQQLVSAVDIAPTLLELAGLPALAGMQGVSFAATLTDPDLRARQYIFAERNWHGANAHERVVRSLHWLYKENQYPLHGDCIGNPYAGKPSFREFEQAYQRGELDAIDSACFAVVRPPAELLAVDGSGRALHDNRIAEPLLSGVTEQMRSVLNEWRRRTGDSNYVPYVPEPKAASLSDESG